LKKNLAFSLQYSIQQQRREPTMKNLKKMPSEEVLSIISSIPPAAKGIFAIKTVTEKNIADGTVLKKSRVSKEPTPARFHKITTVFDGTATMGTDYEEMVNATLAREGKEADFQALGTYCKPVSENLLIFEYSGKDESKRGQLYFRMYIDYMATGGVLQYFDANGEEISPEEYKRIAEEYLPTKSKSERQGTDKEIKPRNVSAENVYFLKRGEVWLKK
jgi:hypothetical protein